MILPRGVTGFLVWKKREDVPPPVDVGAFKNATYAAAHQLGATQVLFDLGPHPGRNFHRATLVCDQGAVQLLCNERFPLVACADAGGAYLDVPEVEAEFAATGYFRVIGGAEANAQPDHAALSGLDPFEREQARKWRAERLGDIVFNEWD
jgi:hypothetical protein